MPYNQEYDADDEQLFFFNEKIMHEEEEWGVEIPMHMQRKVGQTFLGICDYRRAVITIDSLFVIAAIILVFTENVSGRLEELKQSFDDTLEDEELLQQTIFQNYYTNRSILLAIANATSIFSIFGGIYFRAWPVKIHVCCTIIEFVVFINLKRSFVEDSVSSNLVDSKSIDWMTSAPVHVDIINSSIMAVYLYPHFRFISEIRTKVLTEESYYRREAYLYCCNKR
jgi:hypothetical protein